MAKELKKHHSRPHHTAPHHPRACVTLETRIPLCHLRKQHTRKQTHFSTNTRAIPSMKFTTTLLAASAAALALTTGTEARVGGSHGRRLDRYFCADCAADCYGCSFQRRRACNLWVDLIPNCPEEANQKMYPWQKRQRDEDDNLGRWNPRDASTWTNSWQRDEDDNLGWQRPTWGGLATWIGKDIFFKPFADGSCGPNNRC